MRLDVYFHFAEPSASLVRRLIALERQGEHIMSKQDQVDALTARLTDAVAEVAKDIKELSDKVKAGEPLDTTALDAAVATLEALGAATDAAEVTSDPPPADQV